MKLEQSQTVPRVASNQAGAKQGSKKLGKSAIFGIGTSVARKALIFVYNVLFVRVLGVELYGLYVAFDTVVRPISVITSMAGQQLLVREVAEAQARDEPVQAANSVVSFVMLVTLLSLIAAVIVAVLAPFIQRAMGDIAGLSSLLRVFPWVIVLLAVTSISTGAFVGYGRAKRMFLFTDILDPIAHLCSIPLLILLLGIGTVQWPYILIPDLVAFVVLVAGLVWVLSLDSVFKIAEYGRSFRQMGRTAWLALPLVGHASSSIFFNYTDKVFIAALIGSTLDLSVYNICLNLAVFIMLFHRNIVTVISPAISFAIGENNIERVKLLYSEGAASSFLLAATVYLALLLLGPEVLSLYDPNFRSYGVLLAILGIGHLADTFAGAGGYLLIAFGKASYLFYNSLATIVLNLILAFVLIQAYGVIGAAIATTACYAIKNAIIVLELAYEKHVHPFSRKHVLNAAIVGAVTAATFILNIYTWSVFQRGALLVATVALLLGLGAISYRDYAAVLVPNKLRKRLAAKRNNT